MGSPIDNSTPFSDKMEILLQENDVRFLGYSRKDYKAMFALDENQLHNMRFLDYAGALNGFTYEMMRDSLRAVCVDPLYTLSPNLLEGKIELACLNLTRYLEENFDQVLIEKSNIAEEMINRRSVALRTLDSYDSAKKAGYYHKLALPDLGFEDKSFDMALCSHFLFTYSKYLSLDFHIASILELSRVAYQVRIFPLVDSKGELSPHIGPVLAALQEKGLEAQIKQVEHKFQRTGNAMLLVGSTACELDAR